MDKRLKLCCCISWCLSATPPPAVWCRLVVQVQCELSVCDPYHMIIRLITAHMQFPGNAPLMIPMENTRVPRRNQSTGKKRKRGTEYRRTESFNLCEHAISFQTTMSIAWVEMFVMINRVSSWQLSVSFTPSMLPTCVVTLLHVERMPSHILPI